MKFLKSWDLSGYSERTLSKRPTYQNWAFRDKLFLRCWPVILRKLHTNPSKFFWVDPPGEKRSWEETRSSGTGGSNPGQKSWSVSGGEAHIPQSQGTKGNQEGWPSWEEYRSGGRGGPHPGVDISSPDLSPRANPYCGVKCSQGLFLPATPFIGKQESSSTCPEPNDGIIPSPV